MVTPLLIFFLREVKSGPIAETTIIVNTALTALGQKAIGEYYIQEIFACAPMGEWSLS